MDYERIDFKTGQVLTADALNHMQEGIEKAMQHGANIASAAYTDLVSLRDEGKLTAGAFYRITDYMTTTAQFGTLSAGHPFDVIVLALSKNALAEEAYAVHSERDTEGYFANSNLSAWKIWYSLDNDTAKFAWADAENGKGVIYRMIDEFNNDIPYDFKNIQFKRYILEADDAFATDVAKGGELNIVKEKLQKMSHKIHTNFWYYGEYVSDVYPDANPETRYVPFGDVEYLSEGPQVLCEIDENNYGWFYTFHNNDGDASLLKPNANANVRVCDNTIKDSHYVFNVEEGTGSWNPTKINAQSLNNIVFVGDYCYGNSFGCECHSNTFDNRCYNNSLGYECHSNSFGYECHSNTFGNSCYNNSFGDYCHLDTFGYGCYSNTFGNNCQGNSFGYNCESNTLGNNCDSNSFGNDCYRNDLKAYYRYITFGEGVRGVTLQNDDNGDYAHLVQNYRVASYLQGSDSDPYVIPVTRGNACETIIARNSDGDVVRLCLADIDIAVVV